ncbi:winged helix DNA-binding domain-containing protein [Chitinophaga parva]|uniref:Winged helix DNA-binding domain-containing protein n=2 Tax=Chitinophaga parva TaxID=2169414 RepID=A0A2T7BL33_9BACT|nr:winged helix DNA-binding domain-containing protein [Chitinophaga parva]
MPADIGLSDTQDSFVTSKNQCTLMAKMPIAHLRLQQQHISHPINTAVAAATHLVAVQAQDYAAAKWALGLRAPGVTDAGIEAAYNAGSIVRTWAFRNTLHTLAADDVHWVLDLVGQRMISKHATYYRQHGIEESTLRKSQPILHRVLEGGQHLTREALADALTARRIKLGPQHINFILLRAAMDKLVCYGPRQGKALTFTLLQDWVKPPKATLGFDEALAQLAQRYCQSRGPVTSADFAWWAGLTGTDAKKGMEMATGLETFTSNGQTYYMPAGLKLQHDGKGIYLLAAFDEYLVGYADRSAALDDPTFKKVVYTANGIFFPTIVINGRVEGIWKRTFKNNEVYVTLHPFSPLSKTRLAAITTVARRYAAFMGCKLVLSNPGPT